MPQIILTILGLLLCLNSIFATPLIQQGRIKEINVAKKNVIIAIELNNIQILKQKYYLNLPKLSIWKNNRQLSLSNLAKDTKIEFLSKNGEVYSIRVLGEPRLKKSHP